MPRHLLTRSLAHSLTRLLLLSVALPALALEADTVSGARDATQLLVPFVGYQFLNSEQRGVDYGLVINDPNFPDTTFRFSGSFRETRSFKAPALGLAYRYRIAPRMYVEGMFSVLQDRASFKTPLLLNFYAILRNTPITEERSNTTTLGADFLYGFDTPYPWLTGNVRAGFGWAWRTVKVDWLWQNQYNDFVKSSVTTIDADQMWSARIGVDGTLWKVNNLLVQGGITFTEYFPVGKSAGSFGGIGWRVGFFPMWSVK